MYMCDPSDLKVGQGLGGRALMFWPCEDGVFHCWQLNDTEMKAEFGPDVKFDRRTANHRVPPRVSGWSEWILIEKPVFAGVFEG
jgi:hypothetical protein